MFYEHELTVALQAAEDAGERLVELYREFQAIPDAPASITTDADRQSQEIVLGHLHRAFPQDALCAEETTPTLAQAARTGNRLWIVDPIDGTRGFARKNGEFSVMIGMVHEGRPVVGIVLEPALQRLTYATQGGGCWRRDGDRSTAARCQVRTVKSLSEATVTQSRSSRRSLEADTKPDPLHPARVVETYSAGIKLALVARGDADIYRNDYLHFHDWDICAGHVLVVEAGGRVTGLNGEELRYGLPGAPQQHGLLASNGYLHEPALQALRQAAGNSPKE